MGLQDLSVDIKTTFFTQFLFAAFARFKVHKILVFTDSSVLYSNISSLFSAAACIT
jgi:hypothetical protein